MTRTRRKAPPLAIRRLSRAFDRLEIATALELTGGTDEQDLAKLLRSSDQITSRTRIDTLARQIGVPYVRVVEAYKNMKRLEGIVEIANRLPGVMAGIAQDAEASERTCQQCAGTGRIVNPTAPDAPAVCIPCEGLGRVRVPGDPVARKQVLEIMELAGGSRSPIIAPGSQILVSGQSLEDTLRAARQPMRQASQTIDAAAAGEINGG